MFEHLAQYNLILVTGPQRSGTTIAARMIAADTKHDYIDERDFEATGRAVWLDICARAHNAVIQCPGMARYVHEVGARPDVCVVYMLRDVGEIVASQKRIDWSHEPYEMSQYDSDWHRATIAETKAAYWMGHQRKLCAHPLEVAYGTMSAHPLWVPAKKRRTFRDRQWKVA